MKRTVPALVIVIIAFAALTAWAVHRVGLLGIFTAATADPGAVQIFIDLVIACTLAVIWMIDDARRHGLNPWPWVLLTVLAGSFGPLFYLVRRAGSAHVSPSRGTASP